MSILTRYLLRAHAGPLLFAFTALTGLLFLNAVAQRLEDLVGKGLEWGVIFEFVLLSLPHTIALTLPMSVLVAVLYTFSDLTANSEITAMAAGGVRPSRILMPAIVAGTILSLGMLYFNDRMLPEANHELKNLMVDLGNKSPTFELREQVVNEIRTQDGGTRFFLQASRIDRQSNELYDVAIHDVSPGTRHRTTYADSGSMAFNQAGTDLYLTLYDGVVLESDSGDPAAFQRVRFKEQVVPLEGVGDILERRTGGGQRSDREMSIAMLAASARERLAQRDQIVEEVKTASRDAVRRALGIGLSPAAENPAVSTDTAGDTAIPGAGRISEGGAESGTVPAPGAGESGRSPLRTVQDTPEPHPVYDDLMTTSTASNIRTKVNQARALELAADRYWVEIHKKYSIAFACLVFVLIGAPIAVRFPRGGVGMTIAVSVSIFGVYWMGLIGGEKLADAGVMTPFIAMWGTNLIFFVIGVLMSLRLGRWVATSRGGGWDDLLFTLKRAFRRPVALVRRTSG